MSDEVKHSYNAGDIQVLEGLDPVRKRPGMYIGSTDSRGLMHCLWEIIDNGVDEALAGSAHRVEVTLHDDGSVEVFDDGRGIPTDKEPKTGLPGVEVVATKLHAGGKFGGGSYVATGGLHGVGLSVVNALSSRMDIDVDRSPSQQGLSFQRGVPGVFSGDGPKAPDETSARSRSSAATIASTSAGESSPARPSTCACATEPVRSSSARKCRSVIGQPRPADRGVLRRRSPATAR